MAGRLEVVMRPDTGNDERGIEALHRQCLGLGLVVRLVLPQAVRPQRSLETVHLSIEVPIQGAIIEDDHGQVPAALGRDADHVRRGPPQRPANALAEAG